MNIQTFDRRRIAGTGMVEYAVLLTCIALVTIVAINAFTGKAIITFNGVGEEMVQQSVVAAEPAPVTE